MMAHRDIAVVATSPFGLCPEAVECRRRIHDRKRDSFSHSVGCKLLGQFVQKLGDQFLCRQDLAQPRQ